MNGSHRRTVPSSDKRPAQMQKEVVVGGPHWGRPSPPWSPRHTLVDSALFLPVREWSAGEQNEKHLRYVAQGGRG